MKRHLHIRLIFNVPPPPILLWKKSEKNFIKSALGTHWITNNNYFLFLKKQKKKKYISTSKFHRFWASLLERDGRKNIPIYYTPILLTWLLWWHNYYYYNLFEQSKSNIGQYIFGTTIKIDTFSMVETFCYCFSTLHVFA